MREYCIQDYQTKDTFASFLPGLAGIHGIPIWCYYVNRGQCIASFGIEDKDHGIMEFMPAHQSYENTAKRGFRTFIRERGVYSEAFRAQATKKEMRIGMNTLTISEEDTSRNRRITVDYFVLPEEKTGALIRKLTIENTAQESVTLEILDGLPTLIPYGIELTYLTEMGHTAMAWMQVEEAETQVPLFRARASLKDSAVVTEVEGGNFAFACDTAGKKLNVYVDPALIFSYDTGLDIAIGFRDQGLSGLKQKPQNVSNQYPCCFFGMEKELAPGESLVIYEVYGQAENPNRLQRFLQKTWDQSCFEEKKEKAKSLAEELVQVIDTKTADPVFDEYCRYTYMDNVLRGGFPVKLPGDKLFYVYSRKHGDLEREYNYFRMLPEFYSQGNGNFRDVNQNRRCDVFFTPYSGDENIRKFYSLIQLDGYNPLMIEKVTYTLKPEDAEHIFDPLRQEQKEELAGFFEQPFTPGAFYRKLDDVGVCEPELCGQLFSETMKRAGSNINAQFGEGYWSDHWTYNLDLVESYLGIFPEKEEELLFSTPFTYFDSGVRLLPRIRRYEKTDRGIRQYRFLEEAGNGNEAGKLVRASYGNGETVTSNLAEKLILLCTIKYAALDAYGMGIEMEGGKPGWYDALNGLPGLFGSSMAETYELGRMLHSTIDVMKRYHRPVSLLCEVESLFREMGAIAETYREQVQHEDELMDFWKDRGEVLERYRALVYSGISGDKKEVSADEILEILMLFEEGVRAGIRKACLLGDGICPTYFSYEVKEYHEEDGGICPDHFTVIPIPEFLEGPARYLKLPVTEEEKQELYDRVKQSGLYDPKLSMYKVCAPLSAASIELGRARAFTPGWLENESIWLHMEYKYLLELLKSGMYEQFSEDFHKAAIPFQKEEVYGRSILENSSFLASSANPNPACHGRGFVARLSGSTVEFLQMWILMMFGRAFSYDGELKLEFKPVIPEYLLGGDLHVTARFLGKIPVTYHFDQKTSYYPGTYRISGMELFFESGALLQCSGGVLSGRVAEDVRDGRVREIKVELQSLQGKAFD